MDGRPILDGRPIIQSVREKAHAFIQKDKLKESLQVSQELLFNMLSQHVEILMKHDYAIQLTRSFFENCEENMNRSIVEFTEQIETTLAARFEDMKRHFEGLTERHAAAGGAFAKRETVEKNEAEKVENIAAAKIATHSRPKKRQEGDMSSKRTSAETGAVEKLQTTVQAYAEKTGETLKIIASNSSMDQPSEGSADLKAPPEAHINDKVEHKAGETSKRNRATSSSQQSSEASAVLPEGMTPLLEAAFHGDLTQVEYLLNVESKAIKDTDCEGHNVLYWASARGHVHIVTYLQTEFASHVEATRDDALVQASIHGHVDVVAELVATPSSLNIDSRIRRSKSCEVALQIASYFNRLEVVKFLVDASANVRATYSGGHTPLNIAASLGHLGIVDFLVAGAGADLEAADNEGKTPLLAAASSGHLSVVQYFLSNTSVDIKVSNSKGQDLLGLASARGHVHIVTYLLTRPGLKSEAITNTALFQAVFNGHLDIVAKLLTQGNADIQRTDANGMTALHIASDAGHLYIVEYLLTEADADVNAINNKGATPLHIAAFQGHIKIVHYLCCHAGANVSAPDSDGGSARFWAKGGLDDLKESVHKDAEHIAKSSRLTRIARYLKTWESRTDAGLPLNELLEELTDI